MPNKFSDVERSYGRCLATRSFITRFYDIFMNSHPDVRVAFADTNMVNQGRALRRGITNAILYASGYELATSVIESMAKVHSRNGHAPIRPDLYSHWTNSLMKAVQESDPQYDEALEARWRSAIAPTVDFFVKHY